MSVSQLKQIKRQIAKVKSLKVSPYLFGREEMRWELQDSPFIVSLYQMYFNEIRLIWRQRFYRHTEAVPVVYDTVSFEYVLNHCPEAARKDLLFNLDLFV